MFLPDNTYLFLATFGRTANGLTGLFGGPVYLVGSALYKDNPGDYDIRIPLGEEDLLRRFGPEGKLDDNFTWERDWRIYYEELKQSRRLFRTTGYHIDFQIQTIAHFEAYKGDRLRLDTAPEWFFAAGISNP